MRYNPFRTPSAREQALKDLENARIQLLQAEKEKEYYTGLSTVLKASVKRLEAYTKEETT
jgi:hypothetical protein